MGWYRTGDIGPPRRDRLFREVCTTARRNLIIRGLKTSIRPGNRAGIALEHPDVVGVRRARPV